MEGYWNPNAWGCLVSQECFSRVPHLNTTWREKYFHIETWKKVLNLYNIDYILHTVSQMRAGILER